VVTQEDDRRGPGPDRRAEPDIEALLARIGRWPDDERAAASAAARSRRRWLRQQVAESATLGGLLITLAERGAAVVVGTPGRRLAGTITGVTARVCVIDLPHPPGATAVAAIDAITSIEGGPGDIHDDRVPATDHGIPVVLASVAADRPGVTVHLRDATSVAGQLANVGINVITVRRPGGPVVHVPVAAIAACVVS
jgi:hypothetical protein